MAPVSQYSIDSPALSALDVFCATMNNNYDVWYQANYHKLSGYGISMRGGEPYTQPAPLFEQRSYRVLLSRLSTYRDTADSFSHKVVYQTLCGLDNIFVDLAYLPPPKDAQLLTDSSVPWLLGTATKRGGPDFDCVAFSNSVVQELCNLPLMLHHSGIALAKSIRMADPASPLIILGGANALWTSALCCDDPLVDAVFVGDSLQKIRELFGRCMAFKREGLSKRDLLNELTAIEGVIEPDVMAPTKIFHSADIGDMPFLSAAPVAYDEDQYGKASLPISAGCANFCTFCAESYAKKPYIEAPLATIVDRAKALKMAQGIERCELFSFNFNRHAQIFLLLAELMENFDVLGLKSQRFDLLATDPDLLRYLLSVGKSSLTCGLEGISPRLRRYLGKDLSDADLFDAIKAVIWAPTRELKIFCILTGLETEEDLDELKVLLRHITHTTKNAQRYPRIIFSCTPLVRFPWTPLEFADAPQPTTLRPLIIRLKNLTTAHGFEFRESATLDDYLLSQVLVRADRPQIAKALVAAAIETNMPVYEVAPRPLLDAMLADLDKQGFSLDNLLAARPTNCEKQAPWQHIQTGVSRQFLEKSFDACKRFIDHPACLGQTCRDCGACDPFPLQRAALTQHSIIRGIHTTRFAEKCKAVRADQESLHLLVRTTAASRGLQRSFIGALLASAIMRSDPSLTSGFRRFGGSLWDTTFDNTWAHGDDLITTLWRSGACKKLNERLQEKAFIDLINNFLSPWATLGRAVSQPLTNPRWHLEITTEFDFVAQGYLGARRLPFTQCKNGTGGFSLEFSAAALKKKDLLACKLNRDPAAQITTISLEPGPKFACKEFVKTSFSLPDEDAWVRIGVVANMIIND